MATTLAKISIKDSSSWNTYLNLIYPVGSVYFATNNTSPATRFGGTWSAVSGSRYLRLMNNAGTGGTNTTFKIPLSCMPAHTHKYGNYFSIVYDWTNVDPIYVIASGTDVGYEDHYSGLQSAGGGQAYYPAYQSFYCWYRTA